jgi:hypothetical protein
LDQRPLPLLHVAASGAEFSFRERPSGSR